MAQNEVTLKIKVNDDGTFGLVVANAKKAKKAIQEVGAATEATKGHRETFNKQEKSIYTDTVNGTKAFSKQVETTKSGSTSMVAAYATIAANVFALTAAFGALSRAAKVEQLRQGLIEIGAQSGMALQTVSTNLRQITGFGISTAEAMRTVAMTMSAGFGSKEIERLGFVAKSASIALGRDLGDAMSRLIRGSVKLEPELLDELGIMVRLDEAVRTYALSLNKRTTELTLAERRQAFMNAVLEEGETKFGDIGDSIDPDAYTQLSARTADLAQNFLTLVNVIASPLVGALNSLPGALELVAASFAANIAGRILPGFQQMSQSAAKAADAIAEGIGGEFADAAKKQADALSFISKGFKGITPEIELANEALLDYDITSQDLNDAYTISSAELQRLEARLHGKNKAHGEERTEIQRTIKSLKEYQNQLKIIEATEKTMSEQKGPGSIGTRIKYEDNRIDLLNKESDIFEQLQVRTFGITDTLKKYKTAIGDSVLASFSYVAAQRSAAAQTATTNLSVKFFTSSLVTLRASLVATASTIKVVGAVILQAIPIIGQIIAVVMILVGGLSKLYSATRSKESKAFTEAMKEHSDAAKELEKSFRKLESLQLKNTGKALLKQYEILTNAIAETTERINDLILAAEKAGKSGIIIEKSWKFWEKLDSGSDIRVKGLRSFVNQSDIAKKSFQEYARSIGIEADTIEGFLSHFGTQEEKAVAAGLALNFLQANVVKLGTAYSGLMTATKEAGTELSKLRNSTNKVTPYDSSLEKLQQMKVELDVIKNANADYAERSKIIADNISQQDLVALGASEAILKMRQQIEETNDRIAKKLEVSKLDLQLLAVRQSEVANHVERTVAQNVELYKELQKISREMQSQNAILQARRGLVSGLSGSPQAIAQAAALSNQIISNEINALQQQKRVPGAIIEAINNEIQAKQLSYISNEVTAFKVQEARLNLQKDLNEAIDKAITLSYEHVDAELSFLKAQKDLARLRDPDRAAYGTTGANVLEELKLFDELKDSRINLIENEFDTKVQSIEMEYKLIEAKYNILEAELLHAGLVEDARTIANIKINTLRSKDKAIAVEEVKMEEKRLQLTIERQTIENKLIKESRDAIKQGLDYEREIVSHLQTRLDMERDIFELRKSVSEGRLAIRSMVSEPKIDEQIKIREEERKKEQELIIRAHKLKMLELSIQQKLLNIEIAMRRNSIATSSLPDEQKNAMLATLNELEGTATTVFNEVAVSAAEALRLEIEKSNQKPILLAFDFLKSKSGAIDPSVLVDFNKQLNAGLDAIGTNPVEYLKEKLAAGDYTDLIDFASVYTGADQAISKLRELGAEGELAASVVQAAWNISSAWANVAETFKNSKYPMETAIAVAQAVAQSIQQIGSMLSASSNARIQSIQDEISAEQKRDGKSAESLAKIAALEKKKEAQEKKAFEQNKKVQMAVTVANTAASMIAALAPPPVGLGPIAGWPLAAIMAATGALQLAVIASTSYKGGSASSAPSVPSSVSLGEKNYSVDLAKAQSPAGELAYLRNERGYGSVMSSFRPAFAGIQHRAVGGATVGYVVGERGPELFTPEVPGVIHPSNASKEVEAMNLNFNIYAIDSQSVESMLTSNRGTIIRSIREAANQHGELFLERVQEGSLT